MDWFFPNQLDDQRNLCFFSICISNEYVVYVINFIDARDGFIFFVLLTDEF